MVLLVLALACTSSDEPEAAPPKPPSGSQPARPPGPGGRPPGPPSSAAAAPTPADPSTFSVRGTGGRNILWVSLDTVSADHLAAYGGRVPTPSLDSLGAVRVETAISHFPETALSHWSMFTGVLPEVHGNVPGNGTSIYAGPTLAELAGARGYATGAFIGGVTLRNGQCGLARGFDRYDDTIDASADTRPAPQTVAAATAWLGEQTEPWFAFVHLFDAHLPYTPADPKRFDPDYTGTVTGTDASLDAWRDSRGEPPARELEHAIALYDAEIAEMDAALAPLFARLGPNDIVVVTADHGESFAHSYYFNHRAVLYEDTLHVPLLVRAPGLKAGSVSGMVGLIDLAPTVAELAGWDVTAPWMGQNRAGLLRGEGGGGEVAWSLTDPWLPARAGEPGPRLSKRTPTTKWIVEENDGACSYDLVADPEEMAGNCGQPGTAIRTEYDALIASMKSLQREPPERQGPTVTREMLEKLGYMDPKAPRPPPGQPPPGQPPPSPPPSGR